MTGCATEGGVSSASILDRGGRTTLGIIVTALALIFGSGCGGGGGGSDENPVPTPTPVPTTTSTTTPVPQPTATQVGPTTATVSIDLTATAALQGFDVRLAYPTDIGGFSGSGENVECTTASTGTFVKNDTDDGNLALILARPTALAFPVRITCTFEQAPGHTLGSDDLVATVREVTSNATVGNPASLRVHVSSSPAR